MPNTSIFAPQPGYGYQAPDWLGMGLWGNQNPISSPALGLSKQMLDGTDAFGANSMPGAYALGAAPGAAQAPGGGWLSGFMGTKDAPGWGGMAIGGAGALATAYLGMKQYGLAKDTLAENKKQFELNFGAQRNLTNASLEDRQRARVASNPGAYESVGDYMQKNGVR